MRTGGSKTGDQYFCTVRTRNAVIKKTNKNTLMLTRILDTGVVKPKFKVSILNMFKEIK